VLFLHNHVIYIGIKRPNL